MFLLTIISRVDSLHTHIKSDDEVIEIQAQAQTISYGYLLVELRELKLSTWLLLIIAKRPDITCIYKHSSLKFPEERRAILGIEV